MRSRSILWLSIAVLLAGCPKSEPKPDPAQKDQAASSDEAPKKKAKPKAASEDDDDDDDTPAAKSDHGKSKSAKGDDDQAQSAAPPAPTASDFALRIVTKPGSPKATMVLDYKLDGAKKTATLETVDVGGGDGALAGAEPVTFDAAGKHAKIVSPNLDPGDFDEKPVIAHLPKDAIARGGLVTQSGKAWYNFTVYSVLRVDDGHVKVVRQQWQSGSMTPDAEKTFAPFAL